MIRDMELPRIIFYGHSGIEAEIIEKGLSNLGFTIASVDEGADLLSALNIDPRAIVLIDSEGRHAELKDLLPRIQALQKDPIPIFVMDSRDRFGLEPPGVRIIPSERRLRGAVFGIVDYVGLDLRSR